MLPIVAMALFIDSMGIGIIIPVAPQLVMQLSGASLADAAPIAGWLTLAYASMQFIFSPILGNLSDRYGRKPILLASLAALSVDYVLMGLAPSLAWLFVGRIIAGIAGATFSTANAVVADIIPPDQRAKYFGLNGALIRRNAFLRCRSLHGDQLSDRNRRTQRNLTRKSAACVLGPPGERARCDQIDASHTRRRVTAVRTVHVPDRP
jgi:MFS-type transporter involved in bile tolerance (Atg22 family)